MLNINLMKDIKKNIYIMFILCAYFNFNILLAVLLQVMNLFSQNLNSKSIITQKRINMHFISCTILIS